MEKDYVQKSIRFPKSMIQFINYQATMSKMPIDQWIMLACGEKLHRLANEDIVELEFEEESFQVVKYIAENEEISVLDWIDKILEREIQLYKENTDVMLGNKKPEQKHTEDLQEFFDKHKPRIDPNNIEELKKRYPGVAAKVEGEVKRTSTPTPIGNILKNKPTGLLVVDPEKYPNAMAKTKKSKW